MSSSYKIYNLIIAAKRSRRKINVDRQPSRLQDRKRDAGKHTCFEAYNTSRDKQGK